MPVTTIHIEARDLAVGDTVVSIADPATDDVDGNLPWWQPADPATCTAIIPLGELIELRFGAFYVHVQSTDLVELA